MYWEIYLVITVYSWMFPYWLLPVLLLRTLKTLPRLSPLQRSMIILLPIKDKLWQKITDLQEYICELTPVTVKGTWVVLLAWVEDSLHIIV